MKNSILKYWIAGTLLAFAGVAAVRLISIKFTGKAQIIISISGYVLALSGLFIITLGTRKRSKEREKELSSK